jgi:hypothetical protein
MPFKLLEDWILINAFLITKSCKYLFSKLFINTYLMYPLQTGTEREREKKYPSKENNEPSHKFRDVFKKTYITYMF